MTDVPLPHCYRCHEPITPRGTCACADGIALVCGDCQEVLPLLEKESVELVFTDPPYGHSNNNNDLIHRREAALGRGPVAKDDARPIANDGEKEANELVRFLFGEAERLLVAGCCCCCCCCGGGGPDPQFARWSLWLDEVLQFKQMIVWDKGPMGMGWHYRRSYETVLVAEKPGKPCRWFGGRRVENIIRPGQYGIKKIIPTGDEHPTLKPVGLPKVFIEWHTESGQLVLDPFAGSGITGVAAKLLGRKCLMIEIEERYCKVAAARLRQNVLNWEDQR